MSATYARYDYERETAGGVIVVIASILSAILVIAGLVYAAGTGERQKAALAAADCEPNLSPSGLQCTTVSMLASQFIALTTPAVQQLNADVAAYTANEEDNLPAAEAALTVAVTSEKAFGASLAQFPFPPAVAPMAIALIQDNHFRAQLTAEQARSSSLTQLQSFDDRVSGANAAVQNEIRVIRKALHVRPTASQEP
jgi:hypothetical protein